MPLLNYQLTSNLFGLRQTPEKKNVIFISLENKFKQIKRPTYNIRFEDSGRVKATKSYKTVIFIITFNNIFITLSRIEVQIGFSTASSPRKPHAKEGVTTAIMA